jgi:hypothetical protein
MNQNNTASFILGALVGGIATYYAYKHKDDIIGKIEEIESNLNIDHREWIEKAKARLEKLTNTFQSTVQQYAHSDTEETAREGEVGHIIEELNQLRAEMAALKA